MEMWRIQSASRVNFMNTGQTCAFSYDFALQRFEAELSQRQKRSLKVGIACLSILLT